MFLGGIFNLSFSFFLFFSLFAKNKIGIDHLTMILEETVRLLRGKQQEKWVWIVDFYGFGLVDCKPGMATQASTVLME